MDFIRSISIKWFPCARSQSPFIFCQFFFLFSLFFSVAFRINIASIIVVGSMQRRQHQMQYKHITRYLSHPFAHHKPLRIHVMPLAFALSSHPESKCENGNGWKSSFSCCSLSCCCCCCQYCLSIDGTKFETQFLCLQSIT